MPPVSLLTTLAARFLLGRVPKWPIASCRPEFRRSGRSGRRTSTTLIRRAACDGWSSIAHTTSSPDPGGDGGPSWLIRGFNPRPPCGERPGAEQVPRGADRVSIHAPRAGSDRSPTSQSPASRRFNPRPPCGERPGAEQVPRGADRVSIHAPRAGSDRSPTSQSPASRRFNPRPPCGERPERPAVHGCRDGVSIHAPRAGSDDQGLRRRSRETQFQSTPPVRGATSPTTAARSSASSFNPRPPCGERRPRSAR